MKANKFIDDTKERINSLTPNGVLKYLGLQLLQSGTSRLLRAPTVMAFTAGVVLGAGGGLLFAPQSGKKTRKMVGDWFTNATSATEDKVEAVEGAGRGLARVTEKRPYGNPSTGPRPGGGTTP